MNKIVSSLLDIANKCDSHGLYKEASVLTDIMKRIAQTVYDNNADAENINDVDGMQAEFDKMEEHKAYSSLEEAVYSAKEKQAYEDKYGN